MVSRTLETDVDSLRLVSKARRAANRVRRGGIYPSMTQSEATLADPRAKTALCVQGCVALRLEELKDKPGKLIHAKIPNDEEK
eukprot:4455323-Pyramimonas_sp.AAC.2